MPKKRYTAAQILVTLRQVDGAVAQGQPIAQAVKAIGVTETAAGRACRPGAVLRYYPPPRRNVFSAFDQ